MFCSRHISAAPALLAGACRPNALAQHALKIAASVLACIALLAAPVQATEVRIALGGNITSMDPHFHNLSPNNNIARHIYDTLTRFDSDGKLVADLATSWKAVDELTWEFSLRRGVKFHNGEELTADDVVFSLERAGAISNSPGPFTMYVRDIAAKEAPSRYTVRLKTHTPTPLIPHYVASIYVVNKKVATGAAQDDFAQGKAAIGTGPFKLLRYARNDRVELVRNEAYWGSKSNWEKATLRFITNDAARVAALLAGDVDAIDNVPTPDYERVKRFGRVVSRISTRLIYLSLDQDRDQSPLVSAKGGGILPRNPLKDVRVRQALSMAIDRDAIVQRVMSWQAAAANQPVAPSLLGHDSSLAPIAYNPDKARQLLKEAGWGEGFELTLNGPSDRYVNDDQILQAIAPMWSRIGVAVKVEALPISALAVRARQRGMSVYLSGLASTTGEGSSLLRPLVMTYHAGKGTGVLNNGRYSNARVDYAVDKAMVSLSAEQRQRFMRDAVQQSTQDVSLIPLHWQMSVWGTTKKMQYPGRPDEYTLAQEFNAADK